MQRQNVSWKTRRRGTSSLLLIIGCAVGVLLILGWFLSRLGDPVTTSDESPLFIYCAAGVRPAAEQIAADYEQETGLQVQLQYGGSNTLLSQIEAAQTGDLYLAADFRYVDIGREKGICREAIPLAWQTPVLLVQSGNPRNIASITDLLREDVTVALCNPDQAAVGRTTRKLLQTSGHWDDINQVVTSRGVFKPTVPEVCNDVKIGTADVAIVWDAIAKNFSGVDMVEVPELSTGRAQISLTVLECARNPTRALHLARFFGARDRGLQTFAQKGFTPVEGDVWADSPEITFYCGAVNRRAIEPVLNEFREREGVQINTVFNGCGILTGQMKSILADGDMPGFPDTYMACDVHYLNVVRELFQDDVNVSDTRLVICVPRGNPKQIKSLDDLAQPGISLALGQPDQCTIGVLTKNVLQQAGLYDKVLANHPAEKPTSAMLVPAVTTGAVDATLAYATDAKSSAGKLDIIPIELDTARAIQPFSIARSSQHINLSRRLFEHLARSRHHFEAAGFHWRLDDDAAAPRDAE